MSSKSATMYGGGSSPPLIAIVMLSMHGPSRTPAVVRLTSMSTIGARVPIWNDSVPVQPMIVVAVTVMNALNNALAKARALWRGLEQVTIDPAAYGLSAPRQAQLRQALADETEALSRLSSALRGASDADLLKAAAATALPTTFGSSWRARRSW